jgi:hypothetical protein
MPPGAAGAGGTQPVKRDLLELETTPAQDCGLAAFEEFEWPESSCLGVPCPSLDRTSPRMEDSLPELVGKHWFRQCRGQELHPMLVQWTCSHDRCKLPRCTKVLALASWQVAMCQTASHSMLSSAWAMHIGGL